MVRGSFEEDATGYCEQTGLNMRGGGYPYGDEEDDGRRRNESQLLRDEHCDGMVGATVDANLSGELGGEPHISASPRPR
jgi:hypothetical protein